MKLGLLALVAACGGGGPTAPPDARTIALVSPPAIAGDLQVATVNGRPVWGSCVTRQAVNGKPRDAALHECIDFELLAQLAEQRGEDRDPDVAEAFETALVDREVATAYEAKYQKPADFGAIMDQAVAQNARQMHRPEYRASTYLRVTIDPPRQDTEMPLSDPRDAAAKEIADQLAASLVGETGLFSSHLEDAAAPLRTAAAMKQLVIQHQDVAPYAAIGLDKSYAKVLFDLPEIGRAGGPVRTKWGYDIVLWSGVVPARDLTRDELAADIFPQLRRDYFPIWVKSLEKQLGVHVEYFEDNLQLSEGG